MNILEISHVHQTFRAGFWLNRIEVLKGITLEVKAKSVFGLIGSNGAGKTTLIQLIVGLRKPTSGAVMVAGYPAHLPLAKLQVGYMPERPYFHEHLTGNQLLRYAGGLCGMTSDEIQKQSKKVLDLVGMSHAAEKELKAYSKGMLQRIGIAQAILHDPELLVLDEPMSGLDPNGRKDIRDLIRMLSEEGKTIFFTSHIVSDVEAICDQVAVIRKGKLTHSGPTHQFVSSLEGKIEIGLRGTTVEKAEKWLKGHGSTLGIPDGVRIVLKGKEDLHHLLEKSIHAGAEILWVTPLRHTLEEVFERESPT